MIKDNVVKLVSEAFPLLDALGLYWWCAAGTALGIHRDKFSNEFIEHDTDIDVHILTHATQAAREKQYVVIAKTLKDHGFDVAPGNFRDMAGNYMYQLLAVKYETILDLNFMVPSGDDLVMYTYDGIIRQPAILTERLNLAKLWEDEHQMIAAPLPSPIEWYLKLYYGPMWKTPMSVKMPWQQVICNLEMQNRHDH